MSTGWLATDDDSGLLGVAAVDNTEQWSNDETGHSWNNRWSDYSTSWRTTSEQLGHGIQAKCGALHFSDQRRPRYWWCRPETNKQRIQGQARSAFSRSFGCCGEWSYREATGSCRPVDDDFATRRWWLASRWCLLECNLREEMWKITPIFMYTVRNLKKISPIVNNSNFFFYFVKKYFHMRARLLHQFLFKHRPTFILAHWLRIRKNQTIFYCIYIEKYLLMLIH